MEYKDYYGTVEFSAPDNVLFGKVLGIRGLILYQGNSLQELRSDFEDSIDDYLEMCIDDGIEPQKSYKGNFNVRIAPELHRQLANHSIANSRSLNSTVEEAIRKYVT